MQWNKKRIWTGILLGLAIIGPGIITGSVDNDAGGVTTYSLAGANYGYNLIWTLIPCFIVLFVVQEMNARMGVVTGQGLADLIRSNFGLRITFYIFVGLLIADIGNTATEFAGVAGSMQIFGISKYIVVPIIALLIWFLVLKTNYKIAEKIFLVFSFALLSYIVSAIISKPDWAAIGHSVIHPTIIVSPDYIAMVVGLIGTTIAPWMQFYMQSSVMEKGLQIKDYKFVMADVLLGCLATTIVAFFIIVACGATLYPNGIHIHEAKDAAMALKPFAGQFASIVFAFGLFVASIFSAIILPLATSFYVCEAFGFEAGIDKSYKEAPYFYNIYTAIIVLGVAIVLIPNAPLITITLWTQIINGILLPVVLLSMILLINKKSIMGEYTNKPITNIIGWTTIVILIGLTLTMLYFSIF